MGLSIHYQGNFKKAKDLPLMIEEVVSVAKANNWDYFIFENEFPNSSFTLIPEKDNLYGICISPPGCEMVSLSFLSNGKMCGVEKLQINKQLENLEEDENLYFLHTKTQYAGIDIHKKIIILFDYLNSSYFEKFELQDEGRFWETRDENLLEETFKRYTNLIESFESSLEIIPINEGESTEDYLIRMADFVQKNNSHENHNHDEEEFPKLNISDENEFKKLKLSIEHGPIFFGKGNANVPPEMEGQFLDNVFNFEKAFQNSKPISVFEKIGKPEFKPEDTLSDIEIIGELEYIMEIMHQNGLALDVLADYENENRLIYSFITNELFQHEIDDINIPGMVTNFIYEEFHQNHEYDLKHATDDFLRMFLNTKSDFYDEYHSKDASNHEDLNNFRSLFKKFKILFFNFKDITFDEENATVEFSIDFWGKIKKSDTKIFYSGDGTMNFKYEYGYWYVNKVVLPIND